MPSVRRGSIRSRLNEVKEKLRLLWVGANGCLFDEYEDLDLISNAGADGTMRFFVGIAAEFFGDAPKTAKRCLAYYNIDEFVSFERAANHVMSFLADAMAERQEVKK